MDRRTLILRTEADRTLAKSWVDQMPPNASVSYRLNKRTVPQNDRMWALLTEVSEGIEYYGLRLSPSDWKDVFSASLKRELRAVPNLDGTGSVLLGQRTSEMTVREMSDLIELIQAFAAERGFTFKKEAA